MATNVRKIRDQGSYFSHKTASFMLTSSTTLSKNPFHIRPLIRTRKKRNGFFIVASTLGATRWLLILAIRQQALCCRPLILYQKNQHHIPPLIRSRK